MSRLEELLQTLCPDGVEYVTLGDISIIDSSGVDKKIVDGERTIFLLNYMDVYRNSFIDKSVITMQVTASEKKIASCDIQQGDIFITPTSETIEDLAHSAVAIETIEGAVYSYHIMRLRLKKKSMITSFYLNYLFRSEHLQNQILHYASGLTRFGLSRGKWLSLIIPLPPMPVQEEIVRILDTFSSAVTELEAEQAARVRQYESYRNLLMNFDGKREVGTQWKKLGEICENIGSGDNKSRTEFGKYPVYGSTGIIAYSDSFKYSEELILVARVGANAGFVHRATGHYDVSDNTLIVKPKEGYNITFAYHQLSNLELNDLAVGGGQPLITAGKLKRIRIPVPSLEEQARIVDLLDRFDILVNDLKSGLPAEIALRRKQYEYYRDKLLTFPAKQPPLKRG